MLLGFSDLTGVLELILTNTAELAILMFEYIGVGIIAVTGVKALINYFHRKPDTRLVLAEGLAMGLEFKLGSEIMRTVILRNMSEIAMTAGIIGLRAALTILLHWEIKNEKQERQEEAAEKKKAKTETEKVKAEKTEVKK